VTDEAAIFVASAAFLGTILGAIVTLAGTYVSGRAEDRRQARAIEMTRLRDAQTFRETAEQRVRDTLVATSAAWSRVLQLVEPFARAESDARDRMVEALTQCGSRLDSLLVQPISTDLRDATFETERAVQAFRRSLTSTGPGEGTTDGVSSALLEMFRIARESDPTRFRSAP
jgi:hypothetical protein